MNDKKECHKILLNVIAENFPNSETYDKHLNTEISRGVGTMAQQANLPFCSTGISHGLPVCIQSSSRFMVGSVECGKVLGTLNPCGNLELPGSQLCISSALAIEAVWGINQWIKGLP